MKMHVIIIVHLIVIGGVFTEDLVSNQKAAECDPEVCRLPNCRCSSTDIPGGLAPKDTPQFVLVTFDDAVTISNIGTYREALYKRYNSNGCSAGATFYINHEYTNYQAVNELYNRGLEIGLHSITHRTAQGFWANASYDDLRQEFGYQRFQMAHFANIPYEEIQGMRMPFLQMSGDTNFRVMVDIGLTYDHSWPTTHFIDPGIWPYTLDYPSIQDCEISPCPTSSIPGAWVVPMINWIDLSGYHCSMVDGCYAVPDRNDETAWFEFITKNFKTHYLGNRAPFGFYIHEAYISTYPAVKRGLMRFLDTVETIDDVFVVNTIDALNWVRNPTPVNEYRQQPCRKIEQTSCPANTCNPLVYKHETYWIQVCNYCPNQYPWIENPLGQ